MTVNDNRLAHVEKQIIGLEKDVDVAGKVADRFELSLEKMTEVTNSIRQLLAVHDSQIRRQHEADLDLHRVLDNNKKDNLEQHKTIVDLIDRTIKSVCDKIEKMDDDWAEKLENVITTQTDHDRRIRGLERITFIGLGLAMLGGIIVNNVPWDKIF